MPSAARNVVRILGLSVSTTASRNACAYGSTATATGGAKTAMTASTSNDARAVETASANTSGVACAPRSTGSPTCRPSRRAASTASTPSAVEVADHRHSRPGR